MSFQLSNLGKNFKQMLEGEGGGKESIIGIIYIPDYFCAKLNEPFRDMEDFNYLSFFATDTTLDS